MHSTNEVQVSREDLAAWSYLVRYPAEVLLCVAHHVSNPEDGAVGVVHHVEVTPLDVAVCDGGQEVAPAWHTNSHTVMLTHPTGATWSSRSALPHFV